MRTPPKRKNLPFHLNTHMLSSQNRSLVLTALSHTSHPPNPPLRSSPLPPPPLSHILPPLVVISFTFASPPSHLVFLTSRRYHAHFADEETEAQKGYMIDWSHLLPQLIGSVRPAPTLQGLDAQEHKGVHAPPAPTPAVNNSRIPCAEVPPAPSPSDHGGMGITVAPTSQRRKSRLRGVKQLAVITWPVSGRNRIQTQSSPL